MTHIKKIVRVFYQFKKEEQPWQDIPKAHYTALSQVGINPYYQLRTIFRSMPS